MWSLPGLDSLFHPFRCCQLFQHVSCLLYFQWSPLHSSTAAHSLDLSSLQGICIYSLNLFKKQTFQVIQKALSKGNIDDMRSDSEPSEDENDNKKDR